MSVDFCRVRILQAGTKSAASCKCPLGTSRETFTLADWLSHRQAYSTNKLIDRYADRQTDRTQLTDDIQNWWLGYRNSCTTTGEACRGNRPVTNISIRVTMWPHQGIPHSSYIFTCISWSFGIFSPTKLSDKRFKWKQELSALFRITLCLYLPPYLPCGGAMATSHLVYRGSDYIVQ